MGLSYREAVTIIFPHWLAEESQKHPAAIRKFQIDILGGNTNLSDDRLLDQSIMHYKDLLSRGGLPINFRSYLKQSSSSELKKNSGRKSN